MNSEVSRANMHGCDRDLSYARDVKKLTPDARSAPLQEL